DRDDDPRADHPRRRYRAGRAAVDRQRRRRPDRHPHRPEAEARPSAPVPGDPGAGDHRPHGARPRLAARRNLFDPGVVMRALALLLLAPLLLAQSQPVLVPDVSQRDIRIIYSFTGAELLLFGAILHPGGRIPDKPADIIVV